jgi:outer membrane protein assembly factor BamB/orotate phosphoribosyltransferase
MLRQKKYSTDFREQPLSALRSSLVSFLREYSIIRGDTEPIISPTDKPIRWLVDTRIALLNPEMSFAIASLFWDYLEKQSPFQLCCLELTGIPLLVAIQSFALRKGHSVNGVIIRKEQKDIGRRRQIEGVLNELPIIFLDDIINRGNSILRAEVALAKFDRKISRVVALVDFGISHIDERLLRDGVHLRSFIRLEELGVSISLPPIERKIERQIFQELWRMCPRGRQSSDVLPKSVPAFDDERVYYGTDSGTFYAVDAISGDVTWSFATGTDDYKGIRSSPVVDHELVYFGAYDGVFYALEKISGHVRWQFTDSDWIGSSPCFSMKMDMLFVGLEHALLGKRGGLIALGRLNGEKQWEYQIDGLVHSSPCFINDFDCVAVGSNDGGIYCVNASTGELAWSSKTDGPIKGRPCYDNDRQLVIAGSFDKHIYAWDAHNGDLIWKAKTNALIFSDPVVLQEKVYACSSDKHLYILNAKDGSCISQFNAGARLFTTPSICHGRIYFASTAGIIFELDSATHSITGTHFVSEKIANKITCDEAHGRFYVSTIDGQLFAFKKG